MKEANPTVPRARTEIKFTERQIKNFWLKVDKDGPLPDQTNPHYAGLDRCWVWTASKNKRGYGEFGAGGKIIKAHRAAWMIANGVILRDADEQHLCVMHLCDRTSCCRVDHLRLGSHTDNMHDMAFKGRNRQPSGDANGSRLYPEKRPRGDSHPARQRPDYLARGDAHYSRVHPECLARGDANGSRVRPESRPRGESNSKAKLTTAQVLDIRALYTTGGFTHTMIAAQFGVTTSTICKIVFRKTWKHVPEEGV